MPKDRVTLYLIRMPCCEATMIYISKLPMFCSNCGQMVLYRLNRLENILVQDENALLKYKDAKE